jgi:hypothetical protein
MEKLSICIIDDKIPVEKFPEISINNTGMIDHNVIINYLKNKEKWQDDAILFDFIKSLEVDKEIYFLMSAFKMHSFYINYTDDFIFSPDIIVFDWDMPKQDIEPEEYLNMILERSYCIMAIYTGADNERSVTNLINSDEFIKFKHRLFLLDKNSEDSSKKLINEIKTRSKYFSFSHGKIFRKTVLDSINSVFNNIGTISFEQFIKVFGEEFREDGKKYYQISPIDFIEIMSDQIKAQLVLSKSIKPLSSQESNEDIQKEKQLWHFRMYHQPQDDIVRKGDIIWNAVKSKFYLIISSGCHLNDFWKKNIGFIVAVPLYKADDPSILEKLSKYIKKGALEKYSLSSLVNPQNVNITMLPAIDGNDDYALMIKEIESFEVPLPNNYNSKVPRSLKYSDMQDFNKRKKYRLNEPFLSALIELILRSITDIGVPDYSTSIQEILSGYIREIHKGKSNDETK